jgi:hypothetical protein
MRRFERSSSQVPGLRPKALSSNAAKQREGPCEGVAGPQRILGDALAKLWQGGKGSHARFSQKRKAQQWGALPSRTSVGVWGEGGYGARLAITLTGRNGSNGRRGGLAEW